MIWPLPPLSDGRKPRITSGFGEPREGGKRSHNGVDIMYPRHSFEPATAPEGSKGSYTPKGVPAIAPMAGMVERAYNGKKGGQVFIAHAGGLVSFYSHLARLYVAVGQSVAEGAPIGLVGDDPSNPHDPRHLHFEIKVNGQLVDPATYLREAGYSANPFVLSNGTVA